MKKYGDNMKSFFYIHGPDIYLYCFEIIGASIVLFCGVSLDFAPFMYAGALLYAFALVAALSILCFENKYN